MKSQFTRLHPFDISIRGSWVIQFSLYSSVLREKKMNNNGILSHWRWYLSFRTTIEKMARCEVTHKTMGGANNLLLINLINHYYGKITEKKCSFIILLLLQFTNLIIVSSLHLPAVSFSRRTHTYVSKCNLCVSCCGLWYDSNYRSMSSIEYTVILLRAIINLLINKCN